jgi:BirA family transcriptional regulator, biotin operon repressor / biotin---[acetyl-CoA-carboxylase] ligase
MGDQPASPGVRWRIRRFDDIDSTNRFALDAARAGEAPGLVVVADHQRAGRGRRGRTWAAAPGSSLLLSALVPPPAEAERLHVVTMAGALALLGGVAAVAGFDAELKWPNDLVVGDRKLAGVLAEADVTGGGAVRAVVVGIGCNVTWGGLAPELAATATACDREAGHPVDRAELLEAFLDRFAGHLDALDGVASVYRERLATLGRAVRVELAHDTVEGVAVDIDPLGRLRVDTAAGAVVVTAGDVVHLRGLTGPGSTPPAAGTPQPGDA